MYIPKNRPPRFGVELASLMLLFILNSSTLWPQGKNLDFTTSKQLKVKIIQDKNLPFIRCELSIFYDNDPSNKELAAISYLTMLNIFNSELNPSTELHKILRELGNDYSVEQKPDSLKLGINFLPDQISLFTRLLKEVYSYGSFNLKTFNTSKAFYWTYLRKNPDWKKELATQVAYSQLFPNHSLGQTLITREAITKVNLAFIRSYYLNTYQTHRSLLIVKGNLNPYLFIGMLEKNMQFPFKKRENPSSSMELTYNNQRKVIIVNVNDPESPIIFWFEIFPSESDPNYLPHLIANYTIFGYPTGRIYQAWRNLLAIGSNKISSDISNYLETSVQCNYIRVNYSEIESLILLADMERRKLSIAPIEKKEYLDALTYFTGKWRVETANLGGDFANEMNREMIRVKGLPFRSMPEMIQRTNLERIRQVVNDMYAYRHKALLKEKGIIVLVGNANAILDNLKILKPESIDLFENQ